MFKLSQYAGISIACVHRGDNFHRSYSSLPSEECRREAARRSVCVVKNCKVERDRHPARHRTTARAALGGIARQKH